MPGNPLPDGPMYQMLAASLDWWQTEAKVTQEPDGTIVVTWAAEPAHPLRITRAPAGLPFRWQVSYAGRTRSVSSVAGVLRTVRAVVDPEHVSLPLRVGGG